MSHSGFTSPPPPPAPKHTLVIRMNFFDEQRSLGRVYDKSSGVSEGCRGASGGKLNGDISEKEPCTLRDARETFFYKSVSRDKLRGCVIYVEGVIHAHTKITQSPPFFFQFREKKYGRYDVHKFQPIQFLKSF